MKRIISSIAVACAALGIAFASWAQISPYGPFNNITTATNNALLVGRGTGPVASLAVGATGTVLVGNTASDPTFLTAGTSGQVLTAQGAGVAPSWSTGIPSGVMLDFAGTAAPTGFVLCDGSAISRTGANAALFAAIGTTWGAGDGSTTFNVPDFRRRASVGSGGVGTGTLGNAVGNTGGEETHTMTQAEMVAHTHTQQGSFVSGGVSAGHTHGYTSPNIAGGNTVTAGTDAVGNTQANTTGGQSADHTHTTTISGATTSTGSTTAFNQLQPSAVVLKIIKL